MGPRFREDDGEEKTSLLSAPSFLRSLRSSLSGVRNPSTGTSLAYKTLLARKP